MGSKMRLSSYCTKQGDNNVNLVTSRKTIARLARPIANHSLAINRRHNELSLNGTCGIVYSQSLHKPTTITGITAEYY